LVKAQSDFDVNVGFGTAQNQALGLVSTDTLAPCTSITVSCAPTSKLSGFFLGFGANIMLWKHLGFGGDVTLQPNKPDYVTLPTLTVSPGVTQSTVVKSRTTFYTFDGIYQPIARKRVSLQLKGGIGAATVRFYVAQSSGGSVLGNSNYTQYLQSATHFQVHAGVGVPLFLTDHLFVRPELDLHYVPNFTDHFGRDTVPAAMVWLGYSFGDRP